MQKPPAQQPVESPCVRICCLDDADVCMGCGRTLAEITGWSAASNADRLLICERARKRLGLPPELPAIPDKQE